MNHIRALISAGRDSLRRARSTKATEGAQFAFARWLIDGKLSVRNGADVPYPKLRLTPAATEDGWGVAEVEIRQPDGKLVTSKFHVEILTHRSDAPDDDVLVMSKEQADQLVAIQRNAFDRQNEMELFKKDILGKMDASLEAANLTPLGEKKSDAPP